MKCKKSEVNQHANRCEPFYWKNTKFGIDTCMTSNFKPQESSIYKQATEAHGTTGWQG